MSEFPRIASKLAASDRQAGVISIVVGLAAALYIPLAPRLPDWPQPETAGSIVVGLIALGLLVMGARWLMNAGKVEGHANLNYVRRPEQLAELESELGAEVESWGEISFTKNFLLAPGFVPVPLDEVVWAYRREVQKRVSGAEVRSELWIFLASGDKEKFVADASDIEPAFDCIAERRPHIKLGYDKLELDRWTSDPKASAQRLRS